MISKRECAEAVQYAREKHEVPIDENFAYFILTLVARYYARGCTYDDAKRFARDRVLLFNEPVRHAYGSVIGKYFNKRSRSVRRSDVRKKPVMRTSVYETLTEEDSRQLAWRI